MYSRGCSDALTRRSHAPSDAILLYYFDYLDYRGGKKRYFGEPSTLVSPNAKSDEAAAAARPCPIRAETSGSSSRIKVKEEEVFFVCFLACVSVVIVNRTA